MGRWILVCRRESESTMSEVPDDIEDALTTILSHLDTDEQTPQQRASIEQKCQAIHALFGGKDPEDIYPDG